MNVKLNQSVMLKLSKLEANKGQIEGLPKNPRIIKDDKFKKLVKSIEDNPEMTSLREILVFPHKDKYVVVGGNMRLKALKELGYKEAPCKIIPEETTVEQLKAYTIKDKVEALVREMFPGKYELIINGTGDYVSHSSIADCGTTGRKLAVDFYGGNCKIGGGSPWTKDGSKADLALNLYARMLAKKLAWKYKKDVIVSLACCIGKQEVNYYVQTPNGVQLDCGVYVLPPKDIIKALGLDKPIYKSMCKWGYSGSSKAKKRGKSKNLSL